MAPPRNGRRRSDCEKHVMKCRLQSSVCFAEVIYAPPPCRANLDFFFLVVAWAAYSGAPLRRGPFSSDTEDHVVAALLAAARKAAAAWSFHPLLLSETRPCPRCVQFCRGGFSAPRFAGLGRLAAPRRPSVATHLFARRLADSSGFHCFRSRFRCPRGSAQGRIDVIRSLHKKK